MAAATTRTARKAKVSGGRTMVIRVSYDHGWHTLECVGMADALAYLAHDEDHHPGRYPFPLRLEVVD